MTPSLQCRCFYNDVRCANQATEEDGLCNWCGNGRSLARLRQDPKAIIGPNGEFNGSIGGAGQLHDGPFGGDGPHACWYANSGRVILDK